ncbi:2-dehydropantoate 2-reductase [Shewanella gelidii]|uniref:2-dehydropantoate 2-reductase n=2 Tax=Shewanella gelidii TaxID=1642821 RepID=A0A917JLZ4_9GAMM|nr:2-dehydropantoate 2-reductase [Shewanella gelidii]
MYHIGILGAGAIGQLLHHQLQKHASNHQLYLIGRTKGPTQNLTFESLAGEQQSEPVNWVNCQQLDVTSHKQLQQLDLLIVTVKAYQVTEALTPLLQYLNQSCHILLLHNGMGPHLQVAPIIGSRGLSLGTTSQAALKHNRFATKQTGEGLTQIGHYQGSELTAELWQLLLNAIPNSQKVDSVLLALWQKLAINAAINPLTALNKCANGELAQPQYKAQIERIVAELVEVAAADGIVLEQTALLERVYRVIKLTKANFSSMHQDVHHQRQTEIAAINGYIVLRAQTHQIDTPVNTKLLGEIQQLS